MRIIYLFYISPRVCDLAKGNSVIDIIIDVILKRYTGGKMEHGALGSNGTFEEKWNSGILYIECYDKLCRSTGECDSI